MKLGFLYAGQGSQHPGMGQDLYETYPAFREVLDRAETDFDLKALCFQGPENQLNQTRFPGAEFLHALAAVRGDPGLKALFLQIELEQLGDVAVVFYNEYLSGHRVSTSL